MGIKNWWTRFKEFRKFLPLLTWDHGNKRGWRPVNLTEDEIRKLFYTVLDAQVLKRLRTDNWDILQNTVSATRDKIKILEPVLKEEKACEERIARIEQKNGGVEK